MADLGRVPARARARAAVGRPGARPPAQRAVVPRPGRRPPGSTSTWCCVMCVAAVSVLGALMVLSSTRGTDPDAYDTSFLRKQVLFIAVGRRGHGAGHAGRLPAPAGLRLAALRCDHGPAGARAGRRRWASEGGARRRGSSSARSSCSRPSSPRCRRSWRWPPLLASSEVPLKARRLAAALARARRCRSRSSCCSPTSARRSCSWPSPWACCWWPGPGPATSWCWRRSGIVGVVGVLNSDVLEDYQRDRLTNFLGEERGRRRRPAGYNSDQSKAAIASGSVNGKGLFEGTQTRLGFVPEQHTDFIFTAVGEELGFVGCGHRAGPVRAHVRADLAHGAARAATGWACSSASACCRCWCSRSSRTWA